jgi:hypothetical protein
MSKVEKFIDQTDSYWDGAFSHITDDLPDGAWLQTHVDSAEYHKSIWVSSEMNTMICPWPADLDAHDVVMEYLSRDRERI